MTRNYERIQHYILLHWVILASVTYLRHHATCGVTRYELQPFDTPYHLGMTVINSVYNISSMQDPAFSVEILESSRGQHGGIS